MVDYATLKIPSEFRDEFERLNERHKKGYSSFAEFTKEALRKRFEEIRQVYSEQ